MTQKPAGDGFKITSPNPADRAKIIALAVLATGELPANAPKFWRSLFTHGYGQVTRGILRDLGLGQSATWADVLRALEAKFPDLKVPSPTPYRDAGDDARAEELAAIKAWLRAEAEREAQAKKEAGR